jgi:hypothetical protein
MSEQNPRLLLLAEENPDATFMVIVQKEAQNKDLEDEVLKGGGRVKKQLDPIVSFSAEMTGKEIVKLAKHPKVRWISVDAPMLSTASPGMETVRDEFNSRTYNGNNGTANWSTSWIEVGESTDDAMAFFAAYGITGDGFAKPDLVAPGRNLVVPLAAKASTVYNAHPLHRVGDYYFRMSGTFMSAPVVR